MFGAADMLRWLTGYDSLPKLLSGIKSRWDEFWDDGDEGGGSAWAVAFWDPLDQTGGFDWKKP